MANLINDPIVEDYEFDNEGTFYEALSVANRRIEEAMAKDTLNQEQVNELTKLINNFLNNK